MLSKKFKRPIYLCGKCKNHPTVGLDSDFAIYGTYVCSKCKAGTIETTRSTIEVTGCDEAINREFERIERNQQALINLTDALEGLEYLKAEQEKTPSTDIDGV